MTTSGGAGFQERGFERDHADAEFQAVVGGVPLFAPGPGDAGAWERILRERPEVAPAVEREFCRTPDGVAYRLDADRLRLTGNGVVPLAVAYAFVSLWSSLEYGEPIECGK